MNHIIFTGVSTVQGHRDTLQIATTQLKGIHMKHIIILALAISVGSFASATESNEVTGKPTAAVVEQITSSLKAEGYDVRKVKTEDGLYEAYALKDGERFEIYFDKDLKMVGTNDND
jgi:hypothetical protein